MTSTVRPPTLPPDRKGGGALPRVIWVLGGVSLLTDLATEMIYPLLPVFYASVLGLNMVWVGLIEGAAEITASLLKVLSGAWADWWGKRKPLVVMGYALSGLMRPLMGLATGWPLALFVRVADRIGKGLRASPRDALIADATQADHRGRAYGLHRAMDHAGAVIGPLIAVAMLGTGMPMREVFLWSIVPGLLVIVLLVTAVRDLPVPPRARGSLKGWWSQWGTLGRPFYRFALVSALFNLGNAADTFLLIRLNGLGVAAPMVAGLWSVHHVIRSSMTLVGGRMVDALGPRLCIHLGWLAYAACDLGMGFGTDVRLLIGVFMGYACFYAFTEPAERTWIAALVPKDQRGTAFGAFYGMMGFSYFGASLLCGILWEAGGPRLAFGVSAGIALVASVLLTDVEGGRPKG